MRSLTELQLALSDYAETIEEWHDEWSGNEHGGEAMIELNYIQEATVLRLDKIYGVDNDKA
jgi:hypothetical protein